MHLQILSTVSANERSKLQMNVLKAKYQYFKNIFRLVIQFANRLDRLATWTGKVHCEAHSMTTLCMYTKSV